MKLLIDTNVILDILLKREPFFSDSYGALKKAAEEDAECYLSSSAVTDIFYILRKAFQSAMQAKETLSRLMLLVSFSDVLSSDITDALNSEMTDFEDAVVNAVGNRLKADYIITRNTKDFAKAEVSVISPSDYLRLPL